MEKKNGEWTCKECGKQTKEPDKVCMVCRRDETQVRGLVSRKVLDGE